MRRLFAWLVHLYTAMGLVCAAGIAVLIVGGGDLNFRRAFMLMMLATAIDATDGWFARRAHVKDVLPQFDGRALDDLIDFHTYTSLPLLLLWRAETLPDGLAALLLLPGAGVQVAALLACAWVGWRFVAAGAAAEASLPRVAIPRRIGAGLLALCGAGLLTLPLLAPLGAGWAVLDATRKPADLRTWLARLPRVDAVVVDDTRASADPAALLDGLPVPVAMVDGVRATPHAWAALLCERLAGRS